MDREEQERALEEIFEYYKNSKDPQNQENLITMLREIQEVCGFISPEHCQRAADTAGVKLSAVTCLMKLYKSLKAADYVHEIRVCTGPVCMSKHAGILDAVRTELNIQRNGVSADGQILLDTTGCLKHCKTAPNIMIDGVVYSNTTKEKAIALIRELQKKST